VNPDDVESVLQEAGAQEAYTAKLLNGDYIKSERISDQIACTQISEKKGKRVIPTSNFKIIKNIYDAKFKARQAQQ